MINVEYVNPFIAATLQALEVMAGLRPTRGSPFAKVTCVAKGDISGVISLTGDDTVGSVALTFSEGLARRLYSSMVGEVASTLSREVKDAVGEVANMIAGGAKAVLVQSGHNFRIGLPVVVMGKNHLIDHKGVMPCLVVPFQLEDDTFWLEVTLKSR